MRHHRETGIHSVRVLTSKPGTTPQWFSLSAPASTRSSFYLKISICTFREISRDLEPPSLPFRVFTIPRAREMAVTTGKNRWHFEDITTKSQTRKMIKRYQTKSTWIIFGLESSHLNLRLSINAQSCVILPKTRVFFRSFRDVSNWTRNSNMRPIILVILVLSGRRDFAVLLRRSDPLHIRQKTSSKFRVELAGYFALRERRKKSADWYQGGSPQLHIEKVLRIRKRNSEPENNGTGSEGRWACRRD